MTDSRGRVPGPSDALARGLGWFSIGLGTLEVLAPRAIGRALGVAPPIIAAYGIRELVSGIGATRAEDRSPWIWSRVAGDALDVATLAAGRGGRTFWRVTAFMSVASVAIFDLICARQLPEEQIQQMPTRDYSDRSGFPQGVAAAKGAALGEVTIPEEYRSLKVGSPSPRAVETV